MADTFALEKLYDDVVARFAAEGTAAKFNFGWRESTKQHSETTRIEIVPGDDESGDFGTMQAPKYPGRNPRSLWTPRELWTGYISAFDPSAPENERAQYRATRLLWDAFTRALYLAAYGTVSIDRTRYIITHTQRRVGVTLRCVGAILGMVPDTQQASAPVDVKAHVTTTELSQTETFDVVGR